MKFIELTFIIVCCLQIAAWVLWTHWHREQHRKERLYLGAALDGKANRRKPRKKKNLLDGIGEFDPPEHYSDARCRLPEKKSSPSNASSEGEGAPK